MFNNGIFKLGALAIRANGTYTPFSGDAWLYALEMTLLGMGMIFAVLAILWGVLAIFKLIFARPKKDKNNTKESTPVKEAPAPTVTATPVAAPAAADDAEIVAILTAAIVAYEAEHNPDVTPASFRVVSYRRANGGRSWNAR